MTAKKSNDGGGRLGTELIELNSGPGLSYSGKCWVGFYMIEMQSFEVCASFQSLSVSVHGI